MLFYFGKTVEQYFLDRSIYFKVVVYFIVTILTNYWAEYPVPIKGKEGF